MHQEPSTSLVEDSERMVLSYNLAFGENGDWIAEVQTNLNLPNYSCELSLSQISFLFDEIFQVVYPYRPLLLATNGKLLSLDNVVQHESVGYVYQSGQWMKLNASIDKTSESYLPIYAIPYIVRV